MKGLVWIPGNEHDEKVNQYLDSINHAPYASITAITVGLFCIVTMAILVGVF